MAQYGADATLVNMAYHASMANVPKDVSEHLQSQLRNYEITMAQIQASRNQLMQMGGALLGQAAVGLKKRVERRAFGSTVKDEFGNAFLMEGSSFDKTITNDKFNAEIDEVEYDPNNPSGNWKSRVETTEVLGLNDISKAYRETFKNNPFSPESIAERMELNQQKQKIYTQIDQLQAGYGNLEQIFASEGYSKNAMASNYGDSRFLAAIAGEPKNGDKIVKGHDSNGNIILKLFDVNNKPILQDMSQPLSEDNKQLTVRADELGDLMIPKDPRVLKAMNDSFESLRSQGAGGGKGITWETTQGKYKNDVEKIVGTEKQLHYAIHEDGFFNFQTSMMDDLTSESVTSATLFGALGRKVPVDENGNPVIDISGGSDPNAFDAEDFASGANYAKIVQAVTNRRSRFYNEDVTREVFKEWAAQKGKDVWEYGVSQRKPINPWGTNATMRDMFFPPDANIKGGVKGGQLNKIISSLMGGKVPGDDGQSIWVVDKKTQKWTNNVSGETKSGDEMLRDQRNGLINQGYDDLPDLRTFYRFQKFRGTEGSTVASVNDDSSDDDDYKVTDEQKNIISGLFGKNAKEEQAVAKLRIMFPGLIDKINETDMWDGSMIQLGTGEESQKFDVSKPSQMRSLINKLNEMIGEIKGVEGVFDANDY